MELTLKIFAKLAYKTAELSVRRYCFWILYQEMPSKKVKDIIEKNNV